MNFQRPFVVSMIAFAGWFALIIFDQVYHGASVVPVKFEDPLAYWAIQTCVAGTIALSVFALVWLIQVFVGRNP